VIWSKTEAGRIEMRTRALVKDRALRNLLLVIDGVKTEALLLAHLEGISITDFAALEAMGLIVPIAETRRPAASGAARPPAPTIAPPSGYADFTARLTQLISQELGLRGFLLTLAVEKAGSIEALQDVARRTLEQIRERHGDAAEAAARQRLYGG
jgi:hypothetical protein